MAGWLWCCVVEREKERVKVRRFPSRKSVGGLEGQSSPVSGLGPQKNSPGTRSKFAPEGLQDLNVGVCCVGVGGDGGQEWFFRGAEEFARAGWQTRFTGTWFVWWFGDPMRFDWLAGVQPMRRRMHSEK